MRGAIVRTLLYFGLFEYPLKKEEIRRFAGLEIHDQQELDIAIRVLVAQQVVVETGEYFCIGQHPEWVPQRLAGNASADRMMPIARRMTRLISAFPFVRGIALSGSLSKGTMDSLGDIDYFIVTQPGRLWIARTLLIAFKKIFLLNSKKYFCVNYFVDTEHLEIPDHNIFTATEVRTLIPMYNEPIFDAFHRANQWADDFLPNAVPVKTDYALKKRRSTVAAILEVFFPMGIGDRVDRALMQFTINRWQRKFGHFTPSYFEHALRSRRYVSKHHPQNFQKRVLDALGEAYDQFEKAHGFHPGS